MADSVNVAEIKESTPVVEKEVEKTEVEAVPAAEKNGEATEAVASEDAAEKKNGTTEAAATEEATENGSAAAKENGSNGDAVAENGVSSEEAAEPAAGDACSLKRKSEVGLESADASETCEKKQKVVDAAAEEPVVAEANGVC